MGTALFIIRSVPFNVRFPMRKLIIVLLAAILANLLPFISRELSAKPMFTYHAVKKAIPSIVEIEASKTIILPNDPRHNVFTKKGAGVIADASGMIVTNVHTLSDASSINVILYNRKKICAKLVKLFPENDIAIIKIDPPCRLSPVTFANSVSVRKGTDIFTVGHSRFLNGVVIRGNVTGFISRTDGKTKKKLPGYFIKTRFDAHAYKGDSGSPVFDKDGVFLGILFARSDENSHFSLMIPSNIIMQDYLAAKRPN